MKVEIDLSLLLKQAVANMEDESDLRWSVGAGLQDLYWDAWVKEFQDQMIKEYSRQVKQNTFS
jgi:hypothetical protein